jgi:hypothetical protein
VCETAGAGGLGVGWCISLMESDTVEPFRTFTSVGKCSTPPVRMRDTMQCCRGQHDDNNNVT